MRIAIGIAGSIAAYRSPDLVKELVARGHEVRILLTHSAEHFVSPQVLATFAGHGCVSSDPFSSEHVGTDHITMARWAECILVYGATAHFMACVSSGLTQDFLQLQILAATCPVVLAPAMNPSMWSNLATQANLSILRKRGMGFVGPIFGTVACQESGVGHLADHDEIIHCVERSEFASRDLFLKAKRILISAGAMNSPVDAARSLQNTSSGLMGLELARAARRAGAEVKLLLGRVDSVYNKSFESFESVKFSSAEEYGSRLDGMFSECDWFISAAAVLDFTVVPAAQKLDRKQLSGNSLQLGIRSVPDFVAKVASDQRASQYTVAFAAESLDEASALVRAREKFGAKKVNALVANRILQDSGPASKENTLWLFTRSNSEAAKLGPGLKAYLATPLLRLLARDCQISLGAEACTEELLD